MKNIQIIAFFFLSLYSCGTFELATLGHAPVKQTTVIVENQYYPYSYRPQYWRYKYYTPYYIPKRVIVVKPKVRVEAKGRRSGENRNYKRKND